jgi:serine/threonine-protein kinase
MALEPGQIIDSKYRVVRRIGEGGMGTVYEGENTRIARRVAIKVLHAQVAAMSDFVARFEREAKAVARIGSKHVCDVLDLGDLPNGDRYIVMEFLDGISFEDRLVERVKLTPAQLAPIAFELLEGLGTMHLAGVIHRDLKPANVFLAKTSGGRGEMVKILDFGVAKLQPLTGEVGSMTQTGTMMGTPLYMSPEQARGARDVDGRTDIYAASVMFYRALTGELPYNAETLNELLFKIVLEDPKPLREVAPEVDEVFAAIVHKGLARELPQRFQNARAFQEELAAWGKTQGRSSLSFAVTHISDGPPPTPITLPDPSREAAKAAASAAAASAGPAASAAILSSPAAGTPIAWSEASLGHPSAATVLTPISSPPHTNPLASAATPTGSSAPSNATLSSSGSAMSTSQASKEEGVVVAHAQTGPTQPLGDTAGRPAASVTPAAKSSRALIAGIVATGAVAVVAIIAFGRGGQTAPPANGLTPIPSPSAALVAPADPSSSSSSAKTTPPASAEIASATPATASASAPPLGNEPPVTARKDPASSATTRKTDLAAKPVATPAASTSTTAAAPATAASASSTTTAKPAGSARKFRTNLD